MYCAGISSAPTFYATMISARGCQKLATYLSMHRRMGKPLVCFVIWTWIIIVHMRCSLRDEKQKCAEAELEA